MDNPETLATLGTHYLLLVKHHLTLKILHVHYMF